MNKLTGKYRHYCREWDYLEIDETITEFSCCSCYDEQEFQELRKIQRKIIDDAMEHYYQQEN